jgi:hypothetical protein
MDSWGWELTKIFLTSGVTIVGGLFILMLTKFLIEPAHEQSKVIGEINNDLSFYANWYVNPMPFHQRPEPVRQEALDASNAIRRCSSRLSGTTRAIRWYGLFDKLRLIPPRHNVEEAVKGLMYISNSMYSDVKHQGRENKQEADRVRALLAPRKWFCRS